MPAGEAAPRRTARTVVHVEEKLAVRG